MMGTATMSFTTLRFGPILISDLLFVATALVILAKSLTGNDGDLAIADQRRGSPLFLVGALLLIAGGTLSSLRSWDPVDSIGVVLRFTWVTLVWFWIMRTVCRDRTDLRLLLRSWKVAAFATSIAAILGQLGVAFQSTHLGSRQVGLSGHPNHLAGQIAASFVLFALAVPRPTGMSRRRERLLWLSGLGVVTTGLFMSGSISGLAAVMIGMVAVGIAYAMTARGRVTRRRRSPLAPLAAVAIVVLGSIALFSTDLAVVDRITLYREGDRYVTASVDSRGERNEYVTQHFERYLVVGLGFNTGYPTRSYVDPNDPAQRRFGVHNMHLGVLYQAGLPALLGILVILLAAGRQLTTLLRHTDQELYLIVLGLLGCFVAVNVVSFVQPTAFDRFFWMPVAMAACVWSVRRQELRQAALVDDTQGTVAVPASRGARPAGHATRPW